MCGSRSPSNDFSLAPVGAEDVLGLRNAVQAGVLALPPEQRVRLQELSGRAVRQSLLLP